MLRPSGDQALSPRLMNRPGSRQPPILPLTVLYSTVSGITRSPVPILYLGSQNRKNHQTPPVISLPKVKAQVWR